MEDRRWLCLLLTILITTLSATADDELPSCVWNCDGIPDGHYASCDPEHSCHVYISCVGGTQKYVRKCPSNLVWNDKIRRCDWISTTCKQKPNIIYLMADDAGYCDVGYMKNHFDCSGANVKTPFLDNLAKRGRILTQHHMMPGCTPSRHAFMTGRYPYNSQMQHFILPSNDPHCSPTNMDFLPQFLKNEGYATHLTGKWHLGFCKEECVPTSRGFDTFFGLWTGMADQFSHVTQPPDLQYYDFRNGTKLDRTVDGTHSTTLFTDQSVRLIDAHDKYDPMFLLVAYKAPHHPLQVPQKYLNKFPGNMPDDRKRVLAMMLQLDDSAKSIVQALKKNGMWENTFFVFSSDNGGDVTYSQYNGPLRGAKGTLYEGGTLSAAFVHGKMLHLTPQNKVSRGLMHVTDWFATIISLAGGDGSIAVNGLDQREMLLKGQQSARTDMVYNIDMEDPAFFGQAAIRNGPMKLIWGYTGTYEGWGWNVTLTADYPDNLSEFPPEQQGPESYQMRTFTLVNRRIFRLAPDQMTVTVPGDVKLYDLDADPYETTNLATAQPGTVQAMQAQILQIIQNEYVAPQSLHLADWTAPAQSVLEGGDAWATGWCTNVTIEI